MKDMLNATVDYFREMWLNYVDLLKDNPGNELLEYKRKLYFAKYQIAENACIEYENGKEIDLNNLASRIDGVRVKAPNWATKKC